MKALLTFIAASTVAVAAFANPADVRPLTPTAEPPKLLHAGGRHDERLHKAALRARQQGVKLQAPKVHPGGRHDEYAHRAALRAQAAAE